MNLKCGYFAVGGIMCGSLVGIFIGALAVNASLGYMILLLGAWGLCLYITSRSLMDDARREEAVLNQPAEEFDNPDELPSLYWECPTTLYITIPAMVYLVQRIYSSLSSALKCRASALSVMPERCSPVRRCSAIPKRMPRAGLRL